LVGRSEGNNPSWHQHGSYYVYDPSGKLLEHVHNTSGYYEQAPRRVVLPAARYLVKARAKDYFWVDVPVTIVGGRTTEVHLDDKWSLPDDASNEDLVSMPNGNLVGWAATSK
jgi:hypothetical protein